MDTNSRATPVPELDLTSAVEMRDEGSVDSSDSASAVAVPAPVAGRSHANHNKNMDVDILPQVPVSNRFSVLAAFQNSAETHEQNKNVGSKYGHSASNCNLPPRCVKCAGDHHTSACSKSLDTPPKCVNCGGDHTANYSQCKSLAEYLAARSSNVPKQRGIAFKNPMMDPLPLPPVVPPSTGLRESYADVLAGKKSTQFDSPASGNILADSGIGTLLEIKNSIAELELLVNLKQILSVTQILVARLRACRSNAEKLQAFWSVLSQMD
ncbi:uncharacterized protein LOC114881730 [Osmia bicornis bicornis]|uniref:uncharacterized protein LOC114881730 n=1 Tax=Osmia bicornis bicornis TaxID=1437191 RepID=UPI0010F67C82|nr:uncharacterized protein LOC114881730 [Osmia bicornis bicornis]